ncbi:hypothetical protein [Streptomyces hainanensis]|uniref:Uncharacterized protein n=1 Tax=Streptomyces hainanensis TaxID=402648 RepID=A0A4R4SQG2_9ACTN|nr:hypothetical protein [Streptomyces hainanensis]TDC64884.1 hypothetical protein E1283_31100 [Streptomyces hainanensis]
MRGALKVSGSLVVVSLLALTGCGSETPPADAVGAPPSEPVVYEGTDVTVLESGEDGPLMCWALMESYPPQCSGGVAVVGWSWEGLTAESATGTTWGSYDLVGSWDGERLTLTEPPADAGPAPDPASDEGFETPCPEPEGGWEPVDRTLVEDGTAGEAIAGASIFDTYAGGWIDQRDDTAIVTVRFTDDPAAYEERLRELWDGPLCLTTAERDYAELLDIQAELMTEFPETQGSYVDDTHNVVRADVPVATPEMAAALADRFGEGAVVLEGWLAPVE